MGVPSRLKEEVFWYNFFSHITLIRRVLLDSFSSSLLDSQDANYKKNSEKETDGTNSEKEVENEEEVVDAVKKSLNDSLQDLQEQLALELANIGSDMDDDED